MGKDQVSSRAGARDDDFGAVAAEVGGTCCSLRLVLEIGWDTQVYASKQSLKGIGKGHSGELLSTQVIQVIVQSITNIDHNRWTIDTKVPTKYYNQQPFSKEIPSSVSRSPMTHPPP